MLQVQCPVCFSDFEAGDMLHAGCGHRVCKDCWQSYLAAYVGDMTAVMHLTCAGAGACKVVTPLALLRQVASAEQAKVLAGYEQAMLVDTNACASWCPKAGCQYIALCATRPPKPPTCEPDANCCACEFPCVTLMSEHILDSGHSRRKACKQRAHISACRK